MEQITASSFVNIWKKFSDELNNDSKTLEMWENDTTWTEHILGKKGSTTTDSNAGNVIKRELINEEWKYRKEDGGVDLTLWYSGYFPFDVEHPIFYEILMEFENNVKLCRQEMMKLTYYRAKLKVLVTYLDDNSTSEERVKQEEKLITDFQKIVLMSNEWYSENETTEYLLVLGFKDENEIKWKFCRFNIHGKNETL